MHSPVLQVSVERLVSQGFGVSQLVPVKLEVHSHVKVVKSVESTQVAEFSQMAVAHGFSVSQSVPVKSESQVQV